jgi:ribosomal protein L11 methyltransferase
MLCHGRFALCGDWDDSPTPDGLQRLILVPSLAYSNGWSRWTRAGLEAVEALIQPGMTMADIGTGTGILAIAAVLCGATHVSALDVHPEALDAAQRNVQANDMTRQITVLQGSRPPQPVDLTLISISTAWANAYARRVEDGTVVVIHDDASWEVQP